MTNIALVDDFQDLLSGDVVFSDVNFSYKEKSSQSSKINVIC